jgi:hypothetical protein
VLPFPKNEDSAKFDKRNVLKQGFRLSGKELETLILQDELSPWQTSEIE